MKFNDIFLKVFLDFGSIVFHDMNLALEIFLDMGVEYITSDEDFISQDVDSRCAHVKTFSDFCQTFPLVKHILKPEKILYSPLFNEVCRYVYRHLFLKRNGYF